MRTLVLILCSILIALPASAGKTSLQITRDGDDSFAKWERDGVRYITHDPSVLAAIDRLVEQQRAHSELGRKHADLARDYTALGEERARLARELSAASDGRRREIERKQRDLESRRNRLELERKQLEKTRDSSRDTFHDRLDELFERAVREGKAKRR